MQHVLTKGRFADRGYERRHEALLKAATRLFGKKGVPATTVADITTAAGVAKGTFYLHFESK